MAGREDGVCLVTIRDDRDPAGVLISFLRWQGDESSWGDRGVPLEKRRLPDLVGGMFEAALFVGPAAHHHWQHQVPELHALTTVVFPGFWCEFSGDEDIASVTALRKLTPTLSWDRVAHPRVELEYSLPEALAGSVGGKGLVTEAKILEETANLSQSSKGFILCENYQSDQMRLECLGAELVRVIARDAMQDCEVAGAQDLIRNFLRRS